MEILRFVEPVNYPSCAQVCSSLRTGVNHKDLNRNVKCYPNGEFKHRKHYLDGKKHGIDTHFDKQGTITRQVAFYRGEKRLCRYYKNGVLRVEETFDNSGHVVNRQCWDANGNETEFYFP